MNPGHLSWIRGWAGLTCDAFDRNPFAVDPDAEGIVECASDAVCSAWVRQLVERRALQRLAGDWAVLHAQLTLQLIGEALRVC